MEPGRDQRAGADSPESPTGAPESPGAAGEHVAAGEHGRPADPDWTQAFVGMIGYAEKSGWVDDSGAIRAHIERT